MIAMCFSHHKLAFVFFSNFTTVASVSFPFVRLLSLVFQFYYHLLFPSNFAGLDFTFISVHLMLHNKPVLYKVAMDKLYVLYIDGA